MKVILEVIISDDEQATQTRFNARRAAEALLQTAARADGYFGAVVRIEETEVTR